MVDLRLPTQIIIDSIKQYERYQKDNRAASILAELVDFATWAFDSTTFPKLEVIACGAFSHILYHQDCGVVLRRRAELPRYSHGHVMTLLQAFNEYRLIDSAPIIPFEFVNPQNPRSWEGLEQYRDMFYANVLEDPWDGNI